MMRAISLWQPPKDDWLIESLSMDGFGHWLAGFIDGEGCFIIQGKGRTYQPWMRVKVRDDDEAIITEICRRTTIGRVWRRPNGISKPQVEWIIQKKADCQKLVLILDAFPLRAKKLRDYEIWRRAVASHSEVIHLGPIVGRLGAQLHPNQRILERLKSELIAIRQYA